MSRSCEWKDAIIDACVVDWIFSNEHENDPRKAVNDLLCWQQKIALDPAVSERAAKLHGLLLRYLDNHCSSADAEGVSVLCECKLCLDTRKTLNLTV